MKVKLKITHKPGYYYYFIENPCFHVKRKRWLFYFTIKTFWYRYDCEENDSSRKDITEEEAYQKATNYIDNYCAIQQAAKDKKRTDKAAQKAQEVAYKKWTKAIKYQKSCECD